MRRKYSAACLCILIAGSLPRWAQASETTTYVYDARGRLVQATRDRTQGEKREVHISYDAADNRISYAATDTAAGGGGDPQEPPAVTYRTRYSFNGLFRISVLRNEE